MRFLSEEQNGLFLASRWRPDPHGRGGWGFNLRGRKGEVAAPAGQWCERRSRTCERSPICRSRHARARRTSRGAASSRDSAPRFLSGSSASTSDSRFRPSMTSHATPAVTAASCPSLRSLTDERLNAVVRATGERDPRKRTALRHHRPLRRLRHSYRRNLAHRRPRLLRKTVAVGARHAASVTHRSTLNPSAPRGRSRPPGSACASCVLEAVSALPTEPDQTVQHANNLTHGAK